MDSVKDWFYGAGPYEGKKLIDGLQETFRDYLDITLDGQTSTWIQVYGLSKDDFGPKSGERIIVYEGWKTGEFYDKDLQTLGISFNVKSAEYTIHLSDHKNEFGINDIENVEQNKPHAVLTYMEAGRRTEMILFRPTLVQATHYTTSEGKIQSDVELWEIAKSRYVPDWRNPQEIDDYEQEQRAKAERRKLESLERERARREYEDRINTGWEKQAKVPRPLLTIIPEEVQKLRGGGYSNVTQEGNIVDVRIKDITVRIIYNTATGWVDRRIYHTATGLAGIRVYVLRTIDGNIVEIPYKLYMMMKTGKEFTLSNFFKGVLTDLLQLVNAFNEANNEGHTQLSDEVLRLFLNETHEVDKDELASI